MLRYIKTYFSELLQILIIVTMILIIVTTILTRVTTISIIKIALASDFPYCIPPITHESSQVIPGKEPTAYRKQVAQENYIEHMIYMQWLFFRAPLSKDILNQVFFSILLRILQKHKNPTNRTTHADSIWLYCLKLFTEWTPWQAPMFFTVTVTIFPNNYRLH